MRTVTLANLRSRILNRANIVTNTSVSASVSTSEINDYINESIVALDDYVQQAAGEHRRLTVYPFSTVVGQALYAQPADFLYMQGLDLIRNGYTTTLQPFQEPQRNMFQGPLTGFSAPILGNVYMYMLEGLNLRLIPTPTAIDTMSLRYTPTLAALSADADTYNGVNGWDEWVVLDVVVKLYMKEGSDTSEWRAERDKTRERIAGALTQDRGGLKRWSRADFGRGWGGGWW